MGDQRPAQVQPVRGFYDLGTTYRRWANDDIDRDGVDLGVVVDVDAGKEVAPGRHARLVVSEPGRRGTDETKRQVIAKVDVDQFGQYSFGLGQIACALGREVHVLGGA